ncbi:hypothetical protein GJAV_G00147350 [Gymnothorax javanicus]|nr:hypothetical protein GJAV_G00147350 [Gymnothorax javanicus]
MERQGSKPDCELFCCLILNTKTKVLAKQMSEYQGDVLPDAPASGEIAEPGRAELLDECEEQFAVLQQLQNEIALRRPIHFKTQPIRL